MTDAHVHVHALNHKNTLLIHTCTHVDHMQHVHTQPVFRGKPLWGQTSNQPHHTSNLAPPTLQVYDNHPMTTPT